MTREMSHTMTMKMWSETYGIILLSLTLVDLLLLIEWSKISQCGIISSKFVRLPTAILTSTLLAQRFLEIGYFAWGRKPFRVRRGF